MTMEHFLLFELAFNVVVLVLLVTLMRGKQEQRGLAAESAGDRQEAAPAAKWRALLRPFRREAKPVAPKLDSLVAAAEAREGAAEREMRARLESFRERAERSAEMAG